MRFGTFSLLLFFLPLGLCIPQHGHNKVLNISSTDPGGCTSLTMTGSSIIRVKLHYASLSKVKKSDTRFDINILLVETQCEALDEENCNIPGDVANEMLLMNSQTILVEKGPFDYPFDSSKSFPAPPTTRALNDDNERDDSKINGPSGDGSNQTPSNNPPAQWFTFRTNNSGVYDVMITVKNRSRIDYTLSFVVDMRNTYGYLSLVDYPAMIVYSILLVLYVAYAFAWLIMMAIDYSDLVRLQFWILAVILLGFLEKVFFVAEYGTANSGLDSSGLIYVAEGVSAAKRALARILIIIVCEGFGTVKPRLGNLLTKVLSLGVVYFIVAFVDGVLRASKDTNTHNLNTMLSFGVLFLLDTAIVYWIFSALISTRRALRIRKNLVKLSLYNHLGYALVATVVASVAFVIWQFIYITRRTCTNDWREIWLIDCFWHMLFCFVLLIIMVIWRPSANKLRFAYTQVNNEDSEEEEEQGANKNFETVKMRPVSSTAKQPVTSIEAEEDLKWVEQNLPTTAIDKAAQLVLDSEEEVMTTRFESSKIN